MKSITTGRVNFLQPLPLIAGLLMACMVPVSALSGTPTPSKAPGFAADTTADAVLGQLDFVHAGKNFIDGRGLNSDPSNVGDIAIDKSVSPNRVYVVDRDNQRVLGWDDISAFGSHAEATIVIGQPDFSSNACNNGGISNGPTASSLCNPTGVAVDSLGNLYIADTTNHRVLYYKTPFTTNQVADDVFGQFGSFTANACNGFGVNEGVLCNPVGVTLDGADNLYVADQTNHRVLEFNTPQTITAVAGSGDQTADRVFGQFNSFGTNACNNAGVSANSLCNPYGITVDGTGKLYVADTTNHRVLAYNTPLTTDTTADKVYGQLGLFTTGVANNGGVNNKSLNVPISVAVDPAGAVYISDHGNHRVLGYPVTGTTIANKVLGQGGGLFSNVCNNTGSPLLPVSSKSLCHPNGIALDTSVSPHSPKLYVSDASNNRVLQFIPSPTLADPTLVIKTGQAAQGVVGQSLLTTNFTDALDGRGFAFTDSNVGNVAIDRSVVPNRIYVSDASNHRVLAWDNVNAFVTHAPATLVFGQPNPFVNTANNGGISNNSLNFPRGMVVDSLGSLYVADQGNHRILEYNTPFTTNTTADRVFGQGGFLTNGCNSSGLNANSLCTPTGLALDSTKNLYASDFTNNRVLKYNTPLTTDTTADKVYGQGGSFLSNTCNLGGISASGLCNPHGVAVDGANNVYVADYSNHRVLEFNKLPATDTTADKVFGQGNVFTTATCNLGGLTAISLCNPLYVAVNGAGHVFITDTSNNRVLKYNTPLTTDRTADRVFGHGNLFTNNSCKPLSPDSLCGVDGIAVDGADNLFVVDGDRNRVLKYLAP